MHTNEQDVGPLRVAADSPHSSRGDSAREGRPADLRSRAFEAMRSALESVGAKADHHRGVGLGPVTFALGGELDSAIQRALRFVGECDNAPNAALVTCRECEHFFEAPFDGLCPECRSRQLRLVGGGA